MIVRTDRDAAALFEPLLAAAEPDAVAILYLDEAQRLLDAVVERRGGGDPAALPVRAILVRALTVDARSIVIAHNIRGEDPMPSEAELAATRALAEAGRPLDVRLDDHLLFRGGEWRSFRALRLI